MAGSCIDTLKIAVPALPQNLPDPIFGKNIVDAFFYRQVLENLVSISSSGQLVSAIADEWKISSDGLIYDFYLNPLAEFSDGTQITASDVAYSLSRPMWKSPENHNRGILGSLIEGGLDVKDGSVVRGLEVISKTHLRLKLQRPYPPLLKILAYSLYGIVKLDESRRKVVATSGSLKILITRNDEVQLVKSTNYRLKLTCSPSLAIFQRIQDSKTVEKGLHSRQIDLAFGYSLIRSLREEDALITSFSFNHLFLNKSRPEFKNDSFRKDLVDQVYKAFDTHLKTSDRAQKWTHLLPPTVLGQEYYHHQRPRPATSKDFRRKWCPGLCSRKFKIVLTGKEKESLNLDGLKGTLNEAGLENIEIHFVSGKEWFDILNSGAFDFIEATYLGTFSDPDSYLSPMIGDNAVSTLLSGSLAERIKEIKFIRSQSERRSLYQAAIQSFEDERYFVPLQYVPSMIFKGSHINLPSSQFKYDLRLDAQTVN